MKLRSYTHRYLPTGKAPVLTHIELKPDTTLDEIIKAWYNYKLERVYRWNMTAMAKVEGINRNTIHAAVKRHGLVKRVDLRRLASK